MSRVLLLLATTALEASGTVDIYKYPVKSYKFDQTPEPSLYNAYGLGGYCMAIPPDAEEETCIFGTRCGCFTCVGTRGAMHTQSQTLLCPPPLLPL